MGYSGVLVPCSDWFSFSPLDFLFGLFVGVFSPLALLCSFGLVTFFLLVGHRTHTHQEMLLGRQGGQWNYSIYQRNNYAPNNYE